MFKFNSQNPNRQEPKRVRISDLIRENSLLKSRLQKFEDNEKQEEYEKYKAQYEAIGQRASYQKEIKKYLVEKQYKQLLEFSKSEKDKAVYLDALIIELENKINAKNNDSEDDQELHEIFLEACLMIDPSQFDRKEYYDRFQVCIESLSREIPQSNDDVENDDIKELKIKRLILYVKIYMYCRTVQDFITNESTLKKLLLDNIGPETNTLMFEELIAQLAMEIRGLKEKNNQLNKKYDQLKSLLNLESSEIIEENIAKDNLIDTMTCRLQTNEVQVNELTSDNSKLLGANKELQQQNDLLLLDNDRLKSANEKLQGVTEGLKEESNQKLKEQERLEIENKRLQMELESFKIENERLQKANADLTKTNHSLRKKHDNRKHQSNSEQSQGQLLISFQSVINSSEVSPLVPYESKIYEVITGRSYELSSKYSKLAAKKSLETLDIRQKIGMGGLEVLYRTEGFTIKEYADVLKLADQSLTKNQESPLSDSDLALMCVDIVNVKGKWDKVGVKSIFGKTKTPNGIAAIQKLIKPTFENIFKEVKEREKSSGALRSPMTRDYYDLISILNENKNYPKFCAALINAFCDKWKFENQVSLLKYKKSLLNIKR